MTVFSPQELAEAEIKKRKQSLRPDFETREDMDQWWNWMVKTRAVVCGGA